MDNSMQTTLSAHGHPINHGFATSAAVVDPSLAHAHNPHALPLGHTPMTGVEQTGAAQSQGIQQSSQVHTNPDGTPMKRRPGRPKGSTKKNLLAGTDQAMPPKIKRPVGRPRKDGFPAGSVGPTRMKRERQVAVYPPPAGVGYPPMVNYGGFSVSAPMPVQMPPGTIPPSALNFSIDPALDRDEWANLSVTNPNAFLSALLSTLAAPNPVSSAGPTVEEAFKSHLVSLAQNPTQMQPIPSLYSILKTFWLPSSPAYFSLTASASTARTPSEHRFLYWDPQPLVFNGIACPNCSAPLSNKGRISTGPIKIYDIEKPFFIVGCEYVCKSSQCVTATSSEGRKFASTDSSILRSLPVRLKDEFPAKLMYGETDSGSGPNIWNWKALGVSIALWNMVMGGLRAGLRREVILGLIWAIQHGVLDEPVNGTAIGNAQTQGQPQVQVQPQASGSQGQNPNQHQRQSPVVDPALHKMEQDQEQGQEQEQEQEQDEEEDDEEVNEVERQMDEDEPLHTEGQNFTDAYSTAWKENAAVSSDDSAGQQAPMVAPSPPPPLPSGSGLVQPQILQSPPLQHQQPAMGSHQIAPPPTFTPYTPYPYNPYAYMPHHIVNGQMVPLMGGQPPPSANMTLTPQNQGQNQHQHQGQSPTPNPNVNQATSNPPGAASTSINTNHSNLNHNHSTPTNANNGNSNNPGSSSTSTTKRSPRHCCKCGSQECKGKGGRTFCQNPCQDCGKLECNGRNSRRPDKKCSEGWA